MEYERRKIKYNLIDYLNNVNISEEEFCKMADISLYEFRDYINKNPHISSKTIEKVLNAVQKITKF